MLHGAMIVIEKEKDGSRKIAEAITAGIRLYQKHSNVPAQELIAYVSPKLYSESRIEEKTFSLGVDCDSHVPYGNMMVCKKGEKI